MTQSEITYRTTNETPQTNNTVMKFDFVKIAPALEAAFLNHRITVTPQ